jgi:diguanylate cyclase (GGDEF)-like protein
VQRDFHAFLKVLSGAVEHPPMDGTWLCPDREDRERLLDMEPRLKSVRTLTMVGLGAALLVSGPWLGFWTLIPLLLAAVAFLAVDRQLAQRTAPELWIGAAWVCSQLAIAASVWLTGGPDSPAIAWLAIPVVTLSARFTTRGVGVGVGLTALLMVAVTLGADPQAVVDEPPTLLFPLALLAGVALLSTALMRSDLEHRTESVLDGLTGMLNRRALAARMVELDEQARLTREPVGVVVGDIDHFKRINDEHGHARGDAVLVDVAYALRKQLRAFDLAYRVGGEEFLVLLPGATQDEATALAERLREAIEVRPYAGITVTMSFGVACTDGTSALADTMLRADTALYEAKGAGRNCVRTSALPPAHGQQPVEDVAAVDPVVLELVRDQGPQPADR